MGSMPSGILEGATSGLGDYDGCLKIQSPPEENGSIIRGQYCLTSMILPFTQPYKNSKPIDDYLQVTLQNLFESSKEFQKIPNIFNIIVLTEGVENFNGSMIRFGMCIPSTCNALDVEKVINKG
jgi:hypothetical protein